MLVEESLDETSEAASVTDIEDVSSAAGSRGSAALSRRPVVNVSGKRKNPATASDEDFSQSWRTALGPPPPMGHSHVRFVRVSA